ncbi:tRNA dihydrouridine synthase [Entomophthora muscae]|uniref:tRNA dihydrouridine synthase n=1 Tax=Entomophthora muscae TaxID=34485 RepID=A0ACC2UTJ9_9FUNG|nr:tRNA dihydrouridine synthase [Entomophthora muscae]
MKSLQSLSLVKSAFFPDVKKTIAYAQMLEKAGCQLLTVHGRLREQKGHNTGVADWEQIKQVKQAVSIPVFANGNILYFEDVQKCLDYTGADGVMSAEATLYNPALFSGKIVPIWEIADEYLEICREHKEVNKIVYMRAHLFKLYKPCLSIYTDLRESLGKARTEADFETVVSELNGRLKADAAKENNSVDFTTDEEGIRHYPHWICQAHVRPPNVHNLRKEDREEIHGETESKRKSVQDDTIHANAKARRTSDRLLCHECPNVASSKCPFRMCKQCCLSKYPRDVASENTQNCEIHYARQNTEASVSVAV